MSVRKPTSLGKIYGVEVFLSLAILVAVLWHSGLGALGAVIILAILEITFSFENAVINSQVLAKIAPIWRKIFLTLGILVAVFGVRLVLPIVLVAVTAGSSMSEVMNLALTNPDLYSEKLHYAYPMIAAFGGFFLLMISLHFISTKRDDKWIAPIEHSITRWHHPWLWSLGLSFLALIALYMWQGPEKTSIYWAALIGMGVFAVVTFFSEWVERRGLAGGSSKAVRYGWRFGLLQFFYLEVLDASFSFDSVLSAFAITKEVVLIAAGLGIGAFFVRAMTIHLLEHGTLAQYKYLAHGAHYAIFALSVILILSIDIHIPEMITGLIGVTIIAISIYSSIKSGRGNAAQPEATGGK